MLDVSLVIFILLIIVIAIPFFESNKIKLVKKKNKPRICVIVPSRYEGIAIKDLLESLSIQTYKINMSDVYFILEGEDDTSIPLIKKYKASMFYRKDFCVKTKGYAIKEFIDYILPKNKYDLYFIFDADNKLDKNYIKAMVRSYHDGYLVSTGKRVVKNPDNFVSLSNALVFHLINNVINALSKKSNGSILLSGTGYYVSSEVLNKLNTFPFYSLCEDVESSMYYTLEGIPMDYNSSAIYYDEQPTNLLMSIKQKKRWILGYFINYFKHIKLFKNKLGEEVLNKRSIITSFIGILPIVLLVLFIICFTIAVSKNFEDFMFIISSIYLVIMIFSSIILLSMDNIESASYKSILITIILHPLYLLTYVISLILVIISKGKLEWEKIPHKE